MSMSALAFQNLQESGRMAARSRGKVFKTSRRLCQERFACTGDGAVYECDECGTLQCEQCEKKLHESARFVFHDRNRIVFSKRLCGIHCDPPNEAVINCQQCQTFMCSDCDAKMHSRGKRRTHERNIIQLELRGSSPQAMPTQSEIFDFEDHSDKFITCHFGSNDDFQKPSSPVQSKTSPVAIPGKAAIVTPLDSSTSGNPHTAVAMVTPQSSGQPVNPQLQSEVCTTLGAVMESLKMDDSQTTSERSSLVEKDDGASTQETKDTVCAVEGFLLVDKNEVLQVKNVAEFLERLNCSEEDNVKVVSIFGNTGDGKSYTLNQTFYNKQEVFKTSPSQDSCTVGVWAAYDSNLKVITVDTEGLLGTTSQENQRTRLLLKVLALSDIIIYRTRADRLHNDLFRFLGDASDAYEKHFAKALKRAVSERWNTDVSFTTLGPAVIVFHETTHTVPLGASGKKSPETLLKERFKHEGKHVNAFSSVHYVGTQSGNKETDFSTLQKVIKQQIENTTVRSARSPLIIFQALKVLNDKFNGKIEEVVAHTFPDEYFTCSAKCLSCNHRCALTMNHLKDKVGHDMHGKCRYQHQYENKVYICQKCHHNGKTTFVVPKTCASSDNTWFGLAKYAWSGYVLECPSCGIIYRSREYWYGNRDPVDSAVRTEIRHVWPGGNPVLQGTHNAARKLLDGLSHVAGSVGYVSAKPTKIVSDWMTDKIAPAYWVPNSEIIACVKCQVKFYESGETKHHCRACGQGFCDNCSSRRRPVPERGWGEMNVRVCDNCFDVETLDIDMDKEAPESIGENNGDQVTARKVGEVMASTLGVVASALEYPKGFVVDAARPAYWKPNSEIDKCCCCKEEFNIKLPIHHCRACGDGVCEECSKNREPVPSRGWDQPVRVCNNCHNADD